MYFHDNQRPPVQPLSYWLAPRTSSPSPDREPTRLRDLAWIFGQYRGLARASAGMGISLVLAGLLTLWRSPGLIWLWAILIVCGLGLVFNCRVIVKRKLPAIVHAKSPMASRAPARLSAGISLALLVLLGVGIPLSVALLPMLSDGPSGMLTFLVIYLLMMLFCVSAFILPSYEAQHARDSFRNYISNSPALQAQLEAAALSWIDPNGNRPFGPL